MHTHTPTNNNNNIQVSVQIKCSSSLLSTCANPRTISVKVVQQQMSSSIDNQMKDNRATRKTYVSRVQNTVFGSTPQHVAIIGTLIEWVQIINKQTKPISVP